MIIKLVNKFLEFLVDWFSRNQPTENKKTSPTVIIEGDVYIINDKSSKDQLFTYPNLIVL